VNTLRAELRQLRGAGGTDDSAALREELHRLQAELQGTQQRLQQSEAQVETLRSDTQELRGAAADASAVQAQLQRLHTELQAARQQLNASGTEVTRLSNENGRLREELNQHHSQPDAAGSRVRQLQSELQATRQQLQQSGDEVTRVSNENALLREQQNQQQQEHHSVVSNPSIQTEADVSRAAGFSRPTGTTTGRGAAIRSSSQDPSLTQTNSLLTAVTSGSAQNGVGSAPQNRQHPGSNSSTEGLPGSALSGNIFGDILDDLEYMPTRLRQLTASLRAHRAALLPPVGHLHHELPDVVRSIMQLWRSYQGLSATLFAPLPSVASPLPAVHPLPQPHHQQYVHEAAGLVAAYQQVAERGWGGGEQERFITMVRHIFSDQQLSFFVASMMTQR